MQAHGRVHRCFPLLPSILSSIYTSRFIPLTMMPTEVGFIRHCLLLDRFSMVRWCSSLAASWSDMMSARPSTLGDSISLPLHQCNWSTTRFCFQLDDDAGWLVVISLANHSRILLSRFAHQHDSIQSLWLCCIVYWPSAART